MSEVYAAAVPSALVHFDNDARREILTDIESVLISGRLTLGKFNEQIEGFTRSWTGRSYAVACSSGTAALEMIFRVIGVDGAKVIVPANTFFATASAVIHAGGIPVFADIEADGLGIDPEVLERILATETNVRAVVVVHIGGIISRSVQQVVSICERHGIQLVEDAAHALGSSLNGVLAGSFGRMAAFSLYPTKVITSAEGGLISCRDEVDYAALLPLRDHGKVSFYQNLHQTLGYNWRMSEVHAAIGCAHFRRLESFIAEREDLASSYNVLMASAPEIRIVNPPLESRCNFYKFIVIPQEEYSRPALKRRLKETCGVSLAGEVYDTPCYLQPFFAGRYSRADYPVTNRFTSRHLCLPLFQTMTWSQQHWVVTSLLEELARSVIERT